MVLSFPALGYDKDFHVSLASDEIQPDEIPQKFAAYRAAFPLSYIKGQSLIVPNGAALLKAWQVSLLILITLLFQLITVTKAVRNLRRLISAIALLGMVAFFGSLSYPQYFSGTADACFLTFVRNWQITSVLVVALFVAMQFWALRRAREIEVL